MARLSFKKLWIVSEKERAARVLNLDYPKLILLGKNRVGKSTVIKHIFWVFGCELPKSKHGRLEGSSIAALNFSVDDESYTVCRVGSAYALRNESTGVVQVYLEYPDWSSRIAELFGFNLLLARHNGDFDQATPPYLFLPFYIDQDDGWVNALNSFDRLGQFAGWQSSLVQYFVGERPNAYYQAKHRERMARKDASEAERELGAVRRVQERIEKSLPKEKIILDASAFKHEIVELGRQSADLVAQQEKIRANIVELSQSREGLSSQIELAGYIVSDLDGALGYLTEKAGGVDLSCPTCGVVHENSYAIRLSLLGDSEAVRSALSDMLKERDSLDEKIASEYRSLWKVRAAVSNIKRVMEKRKKRFSLEDIVQSRGAVFVSDAFKEDVLALRRRILFSSEIAEVAKKDAGRFLNKKLIRDIGCFYGDVKQRFDTFLGLPHLGDQKPVDKVGGSGSDTPRAVLSYHYSLLYTILQFGDKKQFPVVIDSPYQQGQDIHNKIRMSNFIFGRIPSGCQLIVGVEDIPEGFNTDGVHVIRFEDPQSLLKRQNYESAYAEVSPLVSEIIRASDMIFSRQG